MEFIKTMVRRVSTRAFKPEQITEDALDYILNAAGAAPVGMKAYDKMHLSVVQDAGALEKVRKAAKDFTGHPGDPLNGAPTWIVVSAGEQPEPGIGYANGGCIIENMLLAATDIGLGSVFIYGGMMAFKGDPSLLPLCGVPVGFTPVGTVALGMPVEPLTAEKELTKRIAVTRV